VAKAGNEAAQRLLLAAVCLRTAIREFKEIRELIPLIWPLLVVDAPTGSTAEGGQASA